MNSYGERARKPKGVAQGFTRKIIVYKQSSYDEEKITYTSFVNSNIKKNNNEKKKIINNEQWAYKLIVYLRTDIIYTRLFICERLVYKHFVQNITEQADRMFSRDDSRRKEPPREMVHVSSVNRSSVRKTMPFERCDQPVIVAATKSSCALIDEYTSHSTVHGMRYISKANLLEKWVNPTAGKISFRREEREKSDRRKIFLRRLSSTNPAYYYGR